MKGCNSFIFITSDGTKINKEFFGEYQVKSSQLRGDLYVGYSGYYLIIAKSGKALKKEFIGDYEVKIEAMKDSFVSLIGPYFVYGNEEKISKEYLGDYPGTQLIAGQDISAAIVGPYFLGYADGVLKKKYIGTQTKEVQMSASPNLILAKIENYLLAFDSVKKEIKDKFIYGMEGRFRAGARNPQFASTTGEIITYNPESGSFTSSR